MSPLGTLHPARYLLAISRDITSYRSATEELHRYQERLRLTQVAAGIGSWEMDLESGVISYSAEFAAMLGWAADGSVRSYDDLLARMYFSTDRENAVSALQRVQRTGKEYRAEFRVMISEHEARWLSSRGKVFFNQGRPLLVGVLIDITGKDQPPLKARGQAAR